MVLILPLVDTDSYGNALHDFYIVARGILRRQQAEAGAGCASDGIDRAVVVAPVGVDADLHPLADLHVFQLRFLEVGGHVNVAEVDDAEHRLPGLYDLARFDASLAYHARYRRV